MISVELEPIEPLSAREQQLGRGDGDRKREKARPVERGGSAGSVAGDGEARGDGGGDRNGKDHVVAPPPAVVFGEVARERRPDHRPKGVGDPEHRDDEAVLAPRKNIEEDRLSERQQGSPGGALHQPPEHEGFQRLGQAAHEGGAREADQAPELHVAASEAADEPSRHWRAHGSRQDVECDRPRDLVLRRRHGALHLRQDGRRRERGGVVGPRRDDDGHEHEIAPGRGEPEDWLVGVVGHVEARNSRGPVQRGKRTRLAIEVAPARYPRWREAQCGCLSRADTGCDKVTAPAFDLRGLGAGADFKTGLYPFETIEPGPAIAHTGAKSMPAEAIGFYR